MGFFRREKTFEELRQEEEETGKPTPNEYFKEIVEEEWSCFHLWIESGLTRNISGCEIAEAAKIWKLCSGDSINKELPQYL